MVWYGKEAGKGYLYAVTGERVWYVMRSSLTDKEPQRGLWYRVEGFRCYKERTNAQAALDWHARAQKWVPAACRSCWHLRNQGKVCDFFFQEIESISMPHREIRLRCGKCLDWGAMPPG